jgi:hypothetical protein
MIAARITVALAAAVTVNLGMEQRRVRKTGWRSRR